MAKLRRVAILPALFSLGNGVCGFASIIVASRVHPQVLLDTSHAGYDQAIWWLAIAGWLIFAGMVCDVLDGRMARLSNTTSRFGAELDSLCDVVTFGAAPAFMMLKLGPTAEQPMLYKVLFVSSTLYVVCTILRLARFNVESTSKDNKHKSFNGLPSPAAGGCIASLAIMRYNVELTQRFVGIDFIDVSQFMTLVSFLLPFTAIGLSLLMVSNIKYTHLVNQSLRGRHSFQHLIRLVFLGVVLFLMQELALVVAFWGFALWGVARAMLKPAEARKTPPDADDDSDVTDEFDQDIVKDNQEAGDASPSSADQRVSSSPPRFSDN